MIWQQRPTPDAINERCKDTLVSNLGIEILEVGDDYLKASMPVDARTIQPYGILHGGASAALAETLGSWGALFCLAPGKSCVGLEININHLRAVREGSVFGTAKPHHLGRTTHVWEIRIEDDKQRLVAISRLTMMVLDR